MTRKVKQWAATGARRRQALSCVLDHSRTILLVVLYVFAVPCLAAHNASGVVGIVESTYGTVHLVRAQVTYVVVIGTVLYEGDTLVTGPNGSSVAVRMIDATRFSLGGKSKLVILRMVLGDQVTQPGMVDTALPTGILTVAPGQVGTSTTTNVVSVETAKGRVEIKDAQVGIRAKGGKQ